MNLEYKVYVSIALAPQLTFNLIYRQDFHQERALVTPALLVSRSPQPYLYRRHGAVRQTLHIFQQDSCNFIQYRIRSRLGDPPFVLRFAIAKSSAVHDYHGWSH